MTKSGYALNLPDSLALLAEDDRIPRARVGNARAALGSHVRPAAGRGERHVTQRARRCDRGLCCLVAVVRDRRQHCVSCTHGTLCPPRRDAAQRHLFRQQVDMEGWLCPALFKYYQEAPKEIYVKAEAK